MNFTFNAPFNNLSLGQVSYNLIRSFYKIGYHDINIFPIANNLDFSAFGTMNPDFQKWLSNCLVNRYSKLKKDTPTLSIWHLLGSEFRLSQNSFLYTFHELNQPTSVEQTIVDMHKEVIFSSSFSKDVFKDSSNVSNIPLGFDPDILDAPELSVGEDIIHFGLVGKWENRKNTQQIIQTWIKLFGNNPKYRLSCLVDNPFIQPDQMKGLQQQVLTKNNSIVFNVGFIPRVQTNAEVNSLYKAIDIDLSGLSSAEGWNLPAFNATCLGKWSCVSNFSAHKDWANEDNCILVEPTGLKEPYDNLFFRKGDIVNQGFVCNLSEESIVEAIEKSIEKAKTVNTLGLKLKEEFTYEKTAQMLFDKMSQNVS